MKMDITNKDAKIIYSQYQFKRIHEIMFPTIYIDEYWDYTIDLFNMRESWENFLETFNKEFSSAREYIEESNRVLDILYEKLFVPDVSSKINNFNVDEHKFKQVSQYLLPDGEYWTIDLCKANNQAFKYIDVFKPDVSYEEIINDSTKSTLLKSSKFLRFQLYNMLKISKYSVLYNIFGLLLYNVIESPEFKDKIDINKDVLGIIGDCLYIDNKVDLTEGDFIINDIGVHIRKSIVKSITYKNNLIKYTDKGGISSFYKGTNENVSIDEYLCIMKTIKNQQLNQIDLTVGFEEEIFYIMN